MGYICTERNPRPLRVGFLGCEVPNQAEREKLEPDRDELSAVFSLSLLLGSGGLGVVL